MSPVVIVIEAREPITVRQSGQVQSLDVGDWVFMSAEAATVLLQKASGKANIVNAYHAERATKLDGCSMEIFWQRPTGEIAAGGLELFATDADGLLWLGVHFQRQTLWLSSESLRTRKQFEAQRVRQVELDEKPRENRNNMEEPR